MPDNNRTLAIAQHPDRIFQFPEEPSQRSDTPHDQSSSERFRSILWCENESGAKTETANVPEFFRDLNLDQVVEAIVAQRAEYNLKPFFWKRATSIREIEYRHEVMRDLENKFLFQSIASFAAQMRAARHRAEEAQTLYYKYQQEGWFLEAVVTYCDGVQALLQNLERGKPTSRGLVMFYEHLAEYISSEAFKTLVRETQKLKADLAAIRYTIQLIGDRVVVRNYESEIDYTDAVEEVFERFKRDSSKDYGVEFRSTGMNHVEARILELVAQLNPGAFQSLDQYCSKNGRYLEKTITDFDREIQFYMAWLEYAALFKSIGLNFCYPRVSDTDKEVSGTNAFDLALADKLARKKSIVITNDFFLKGGERVLVVTGPNQGGKTTFARMFGQMHFLASLGCTVPGTGAKLFFFDQLFTHFEREEDISTLQGKLQNDLSGIHRILERATPNSVIIMNEIFSSTTFQDASWLADKIMATILQLDTLCVCVTFLDELSTLNEKTVSMVAAVVPENPTLRTYQVERKPANGISHALAIARKYGLTSEQLEERIKP